MAGIEVHILLPDNFERDLPNDDRNDDSLVTLVKTDQLSVLICGDASMNLLAAIYETYYDRGFFSNPIDILIPAHHGSVTEGQRAEFSLFKPKLSILSTRPHQTYHFPRHFLSKLQLPWISKSGSEEHVFSFYEPDLKKTEDSDDTTDSEKPNPGTNYLGKKNTGVPIFTTFDSDSLFYEINLFEQPIKLFGANTALLFTGNILNSQATPELE